MRFSPRDPRKTAPQSRFFVVGRAGRGNAALRAYTGLATQLRRAFILSGFLAKARLEEKKE